MDALGIFWIVLYSIIAILAYIKLRTTSSASPNKTTNKDNSDSRKSYCINSITKSLQYISNYIPFFKHRRNKCRDATNNKTGNCDYEDSLNHSNNSIAGEEKGNN